jgi:hypothetical protein
MLQMSGQKTSAPAPIGGWNARDAQDLMGPTDAIALDNFFPGDSEVSLRNGFTSHATGMTSDVETLMGYDGAGVQKMFAAAGANIFDATATGAVGAAAVSSLTNARFQFTNMTTSGGNYLWICNGADAPRTFDGSSWATPSLTGVTAADIVNVTLHKRRLLFCFNNSMVFGYLGVNAIAGAVSEFDLSSLFNLGGNLMAVGSWTRDGGAGADDLAVFITSNGEVAVYSGTDPSDATKWSIVGVFKIGRPIGRRCLEKVGADLVVLTEAGAVPLSQVLQSGESAPSTTVTDKISGAFKSAADSQFATFGWQVLLYPKGKYGLFNIPQGSSTFHQYVVNLTTGAWARFKGQNAHCWLVYQGDLYFGGSSGVAYKADNGNNDNSTAIEGYGKMAFNYFGSRGIQKQFTMIRPVMESDLDLAVQIGFDVDFAQGEEFYTPEAAPVLGATWDEAVWDEEFWPIETGNVVQAWRSVRGIGYCAALRIKTSTTAQNIKWHSADFIWIPGVGL